MKFYFFKSKHLEVTEIEFRSVYSSLVINEISLVIEEDLDRIPQQIKMQSCEIQFQWKQSYNICTPKTLGTLQKKRQTVRVRGKENLL